MKNKKYKIETLGCRSNQYESEAYKKQLKGLGFTEAGDKETADLCIVNTCSVTESADRSSRQQIRNLAKKHPNAKVVVTGCLAERDPEEIQAIEGVFKVVPNRKKEKLLEELFPEEDLPEFAIDQFGGHTRAFVKVQDGCDSFCTYCKIPYTRGRSRSRRIDEIVREIESLIANGHKEIVLTGINIGDFDGAPKEGEKKKRLATLVREVDRIKGLKRLRLSSIDPDEVDEELQEAILSGKTTCPSLHIVLQSGSNVILKRMNRKYTKQVFLETIARLKDAHPEFTFTTDVIVGFPGETPTDFEETLSVMQQVKFAKVHMFPFSARKYTRAALYPNQISQEEILVRKQTVLRLSEKVAFELRQAYIGKTMRVLIEEKDPSRSGFFSGHSDHFLKVFVPDHQVQSNDLVTIQCIENCPDGLVGKVIDFLRN